MTKLQREKTIDMNSIPSWGKLVPLNSGLSTFELIKDIVVIGRINECDIVIVDKRLSSQHCQILKTETGIVLKDLSSNGTFIDRLKIGKNNEISITNGTEFWLLPASRVKPTEAIGFKIEINNSCDEKKEEEGANEMKAEINESEMKEEKKDEEKEKQNELEKEEKAKAEKQRNEQDEQLKEEITCAFCFEIMCIPVSVQPCNHRFCGGCLTELVKKGKGDCIKCRKALTTAVKDASFNSIIDLYLKTHPEDKRDTKDVEEQTVKNIFTFDPIDLVEMITGKPAKKKVVPPVAPRGSRRRIARTGSDLSASDEDEARCRECMASRNGFQCAVGQKHVGCLTCGKLMADRDDRSLHQNCVLCTQFFCNLYYPPCSKTGIKLKKLSTFRNEAKIDKELLRANTFEFESLRNYLMSKKLTSKEVFDFVFKKIEKNEFSYIFDRKIMRIAPTASKEIKLEAEDSVCDSCWKDLWFQMVFFYRTEFAADMPSSVKDRPTCYWGINCKTMNHKEDHAKTYNHMVFQSRF